MYKRCLLLTGILTIILISGCASSDKQEISKVVSQYNKNLTAALKNQDPKLMESITTQKEYERIRLYILYWVQQNKVLNCNLIDLQVKDVKLTGQTSTVTTKERWSFQHLDRKTGKVVQPVERVTYQATYSLQKVNDKWLVASLDVQNETQESQ